MKSYFIVVLLVMVASLSACSSVKITTEGCLRAAAATEISVTEGYVTTHKLFVGDVLGAEKTEKVLKVLDTANATVDKAAKLCKVDERRAFDYLDEASDLIKQYKRILGGANDQ